MEHNGDVDKKVEYNRINMYLFLDIIETKIELKTSQ